VSTNEEATRANRAGRVRDFFGDADVESALEVLASFDAEWREVYGNSGAPQLVVDDVLVLSGGNLDQLRRAANAALRDWRDTRIAADRRRTAGA
jgi:hypothetical protein